MANLSSPHLPPFPGKEKTIARARRCAVEFQTYDRKGIQGRREGFIRRGQACGTLTWTWKRSPNNDGGKLTKATDGAEQTKVPDGSEQAKVPDVSEQAKNQGEPNKEKGEKASKKNLGQRAIIS